MEKAEKKMRKPRAKKTQPALPAQADQDQTAVKHTVKRGRKPGKIKDTTQPVKSVSERNAEKSLFKKMILDKRRYTPLSSEELDSVIKNCESAKKRKQKNELKSLEKNREEIDKRIAEIKKVEG